MSISETIELGVSEVPAEDSGDTFSIPLSEDEDVYRTGALSRSSGDFGPFGPMLRIGGPWCIENLSDSLKQWRRLSGSEQPLCVHESCW